MGANKTHRRLAVLLRNYNLASVAREIHVDPSTIYRWRDGRAKPSGERLQNLARFLNVDANDILLREEDTADTTEA